MGMFGKPDSKKTNNSWYSSYDLKRWCSIAATLPQNKSDPHFAGRMYLYLRNDLVDFGDFRDDTAKSIRALSEESRKAMRDTLSRIHIFIDDMEFAKQQVAEAAD